jgi:hypothetical protein
MGRKRARDGGNDEIPYTCPLCDDPVHDQRQVDGTVVVVDSSTEAVHSCRGVAKLIQFVVEAPKDDPVPFEAPSCSMSIGQYCQQHLSAACRLVLQEAIGLSMGRDWTTARAVGASIKSNTGSKAWQTAGESDEEALQRVFSRYSAEAVKKRRLGDCRVETAIERCEHSMTLEALAELRLILDALDLGMV